jgi:hypothetical protein
MKLFESKTLCVKCCTFLPINFQESLSAKFSHPYLRNFAEFCEIIVPKFDKINFNFVIISCFSK